MASEEIVDALLAKMEDERREVAEIITHEIVQLLGWGADTCGMTSMESGWKIPRPCVLPKDLRRSYVQDDGLQNMKRVHWIFYELPHSLHEDVLMHRMSHKDLVTKKVMRILNVVWAGKREGETASRRTNCIEKVYSRLMNEKKYTIINKDRTKNARTPFSRHPQTRSQSGNPGNYKLGQQEFYWKSPTEGEQLVK